MKYNIFKTGPIVRPSATWTYPVVEDPKPSQVEANAALQRELALALEGPVEVLTPEDAVTLKEMNEARWAVYVEQKIPLREVEALRWYAAKRFRENVKSSRGVEWATKHDLTAAAGGLIPADAMPILEEIAAWAKPVGEKRSKRRLRKPQASATATVAARYENAMHPRLSAAFKAAGFNNPNSNRDLDEACNVRVETIKAARVLGITGELLRWEYSRYETPKISFENIRKRSTLLRIRVKTNWFTQVLKLGLANAFGPRTFVLDAIVDGNGTKVLLAHQSEKGRAIKVQWGWMSLDKNNNRVFKPDNKGGA